MKQQNLRKRCRKTILTLETQLLWGKDYQDEIRDYYH
jgi:hypothetical protein